MRLNASEGDSKISVDNCRSCLQALRPAGHKFIAMTGFLRPLSGRDVYPGILVETD